MAKFDTKPYYSKLVRNEQFTEREMLDLLQRVDALEKGLAYLASCQAATLAGLPKSTSKSARSRHVNICKMAAEFLDGNLMSLRYPTEPEHAKKRCLEAIQINSN